MILNLRRKIIQKTKLEESEIKESSQTPVLPSFLHSTTSKLGAASKTTHSLHTSNSLIEGGEAAAGTAEGQSQLRKVSKTTDQNEVAQEEFDTPKELKELIEAGLQFGHKKSMVHPGMLPYIFGVRTNVHIIDIAKTYEKLNQALEVIKKLTEEGKIILFVGTKLPVRNLVRELAEELNMPYVINRWLGGTITNWNSIRSRIEYLKELREKKSSEDWEKYTKHERLQMEREIAKLENTFGGIENLEKIPDAVFLVSVYENKLTVKEAKKTNVVSIGIVDTNVNPNEVDYPIPANDDSKLAVSFILNKVKETILKNRKVKIISKVQKIKK